MIIEIAHAASQTAAHAADIVANAPDIVDHAVATATAIGETIHQTEQEQGILGKFGINWKLLLAQLINFGIIIFVLTKWVFKPLIRTIEERQGKIDTGLKHAALAEEKLAAAEADQATILNRARNQAKEIVDDGRSKGEHEKQQRIEASKRIIEQQLLESKERLSHEATDARAAIKKDVASLVLAAVEKVANSDLTTAHHRKLIDEAIRSLEKTA